jgi:hypothetical protein
MPERGRIEDAVDLGGKLQRLHQIAGAPMLLIGREKYAHAARSQPPHSVEHPGVDVRFASIPIVEQRFGVGHVEACSDGFEQIRLSGREQLPVVGTEFVPRSGQRRLKRVVAEEIVRWRAVD